MEAVFFPTGPRVAGRYTDPTSYCHRSNTSETPGRSAKRAHAGRPPAFAGCCLRPGLLSALRLPISKLRLSCYRTRSRSNNCCVAGLLPVGDHPWRRLFDRARRARSDTSVRPRLSFHRGWDQRRAQHPPTEVESTPEATQEPTDRKQSFDGCHDNVRGGDRSVRG